MKGNKFVGWVEWEIIWGGGSHYNMKRNPTIFVMLHYKLGRNYIKLIVINLHQLTKSAIMILSQWCILPKSTAARQG
jgi:hypothetical protein